MAARPGGVLPGPPRRGGQRAPSADSELVAKRVAVERYSRHAEEAWITRAETVLAQTGPLT